MKCISLRHNKLSLEDVELIIKAIASHRDIVGADFRNNPGFKVLSD